MNLQEFTGTYGSNLTPCTILTAQKRTRQEVIYAITGTKPPASKAGLTACVIQLKLKYDQQSLF